MDKLNLNHLWYFYITAKEGSVKAASEKLHISQPTISDQIRLLEEFFDCKLFDRRNRALFLTTEGERALEYSEKIFGLSFELTRVLLNKEKLQRDHLVIGLTPYMNEFFSYDKVMPLFQDNKTRVDIIENDRHLLLAELEEENIDIAFATTNDGLPSSLISTRVGVNRTYAVAHKKYKKYAKTFPEKLDEIPYFGHSEASLMKYEIELFFSKTGLTPKIIGRGDNLELFTLMIEQGFGFCIVSETGMERMMRNKDLIVLGELEELQTAVFAISKKSLAPFGKNFIEQLRASS